MLSSWLLKALNGDANRTLRFGTSRQAERAIRWAYMPLIS